MGTKEILSAIFLFVLVWVVIFGVTNFLFGYISFIKPPLPKRFKGKKSPIYRLELEDHSFDYGIHKYELKRKPLNYGYWWLVPLAGLVKVYRYVDNNKPRGRFSVDSLLSYTNTLEVMYDNLITSDELKAKNKAEELLEYYKPLIQKNKEFHENFTK